MSSDASSGSGTIFDKILDGSIPAQFLHQDEQCVAFKDVSPQAPVHFLVIPRRRISMIQEVQPSDRWHVPLPGGSSWLTVSPRDLLGHLMLTAAQVARQEGLSDGYRCVTGWQWSTSGYWAVVTPVLPCCTLRYQTKTSTLGRLSVCLTDWVAQYTFLAVWRKVCSLEGVSHQRFGTKLGVKP